MRRKRPKKNRGRGEGEEAEELPRKRRRRIIMRGDGRRRTWTLLPAASVDRTTRPRIRIRCTVLWRKESHERTPK